MAEVLLLHHAQGRTAGVLAFADDLRAAGHVVHAPDLYDGATFETVDDGVAHARTLGFQALLDRGVAFAQDLPAELVYVGMSLGVMPAQTLAMTRPGAQAAVLLHSAVTPADLGGSWPAGVPAQVHVMQDDAWGDVDEARALAAEAPDVELFLYPGADHLFTDRSLTAYDEGAAALVRERVLALLEQVDARRADSTPPRP